MKIFTESYRITEWLRLAGTFCPTSFLRTYGKLPRTTSSLLLNISNTLQLLWQPVRVLPSVQYKSASWCSEGAFCVPDFDHCVLFCPWAPMNRAEPGFVLFASSLLFSIDIDEISPSLLFSRLNILSPPSPSSSVFCCKKAKG